ncbi:MAG: metal ABC transporter permease [Candidatus Aminicenantes bacterium]|nr:metal ABC transporter permease [Candidatus Aminicenantes bacterium]
MDLLWHYGFAQRAIFAGLAIGISSALLGVFLLLRREAMIGHGLGHIIFGAMAFALSLKLAPLPVALIVAILASLGITKLKTKAGVHSDTAIAIFSSVGMAVGILLVTLVNRYGIDLLSFLFGDILAIDREEMILALILAGGVILFVLFYYYQLLFLTFSYESAKAFGLKVNRLENLLTWLTAVTIVVGMKIVGLLLMTSLLVIPAAAGLQMAGSFLTSCLLAVTIAVTSVVMGLWFALLTNLPASSTIVLLSFIFFLISFIKRRRRFF